MRLQLSNNIENSSTVAHLEEQYNMETAKRVTGGWSEFTLLSYPAKFVQSEWSAGIISWLQDWFEQSQKSKKLKIEKNQG